MSDAIPGSIPALLADAARRNPQGCALLAPAASPLRYCEIPGRRDAVVRQLNRLGVCRNDRVAVVLDNGAELAASFLLISSGATFCPLNPEYTQSEFEFYLADLNARALVVRQGAQTPAREAARRIGITVIELVPEMGGQAGAFNLEGPEGPAAASPGLAGADDVALVLHTSGTTAKPKRVLLTQRNVTASASHIQSTLALTPGDRCLNVMPLFHIHGLIGAVLASVAAAAGVVCMPGIDGSQFFGWLQEFDATWYTAVPTVHQAVLAEAARSPAAAQKHSLRLVRSSSAPLPPVVLHELERVLGVPVLESYGMTEASHQVCSNPLPPSKRKAGSVGPAAGPEVAVMDESDRLVGPGQIGEIVIRGPNVTSGYEDNPEANHSAFKNGWFRTGDLGSFDADGYFHLAGRIKELINRGGEKITPREIDDAILEHPAVDQAVTFAVPHPSLGEDVITAVVLREGSSVPEADLRRKAFERLAVHKVPTQILIVLEIPKGPTGKPRRIGLHRELGHLLRAEFVTPRGVFEETVARAWTEVLANHRAGALDNFFAVGGDSLLAARVIARLNVAFNVTLPLETIFRTPVLADQALVVEDLVLSAIEALPEPE